MPSAPSIPVEIAFKIIDFGEDGFVALKSTSLVCKIWRDHSQRCLFRALHLTVHPTGDNSIRRLEGIGLASSVRIRSYIRSLYLTFPAPDGNEPDVWLNTHEQLLVQVLKTLDRLSIFALRNDWPIFDYGVKGQTLVPRFPSISRCIEDLCASPTLEGILLGGTVPVLQLLSRCSPTLEDLQTLRLRAPSIPANMEPPGIPTLPNRQAPIALHMLNVFNPDTAQTTNADLLDHLLNPLRSFFDLTSLKVLRIVGNPCLDEPLRQLFEACSSTLERLLIGTFPLASSSKSSSLGLRKAVVLKSLSLCYRASLLYQLTDFMDWLLQELASDQKQGGEIHPSNLESVTLVIFAFQSVLDIDVRQAGALSDILSDSRQYPKIKEVKLEVHHISVPISFLGSTSSVENEHKEKLKSAMGALKERGILQLHW
ncbi:hypothetical protein BKA70DRAFT_1290846 [Coprinopsis sp. MPI-PUGE-AT-0042]|nr:hypothetical protein BKA70DRAFT_1290846 [Coprinopsis sp. MPI-PUGE-AT-0042]